MGVGSNKDAYFALARITASRFVLLCDAGHLSRFPVIIPLMAALYDFCHGISPV